jgi:CheY-like chemotaxis protein
VPKVALYIEDNLDNQFLVNLWFKRLPIELILCSTAEEGMQTLQNGSKPDVIILDVNLPGTLSSTDFLTAIRTRPEHAFTPVIMVSGHSTLEHVPGLSAEQYQYFLPKPFKKQDLIDILLSLFPEEHT